MEKKMKRKNINRFIWLLVGYFAGGAVYIINGGEEPVFSILTKVIGAAIGFALSDLHAYRKNPKLKVMEKVLQEDERNQVIRDRAAYYSYFAAVVLLFSLSILGEIRNDFYMTYGSAVFALLLMVIHITSSWILSKRI